MLFTSSTKEFFSFLRYSNFCTSDFPSFFYLPYFFQAAPQNLLCSEIFNISLKDLDIQTNLTKPWILTSTHKHHITSIKYPPHKCLPEKSCLNCLRILIMFWLFKDPIVTVAWLNFDHTQSNIKKWLKG